MYAIIETGGKQYKVQLEDVIYIEKLDVEAGESVDFKVMALQNEGDLSVGNPYLENAKVSAKVLGHGKAKKITVFTYKPKKNQKRKIGHRQQYTKVQIESIS